MTSVVDGAQERGSTAEAVVIGASAGGIKALQTILDPLPADFALPVADYHEGGKAETPAAFDHFRHPVDVNHPFDEFTLFRALLLVTLLSQRLLHPFAPILFTHDVHSFRPFSRAASASALIRP